MRGANSETGLTLVIPGVFYTTGDTDNSLEFHVSSLVPYDANDERKATKKAIIYARSATRQGDAIRKQIEACRAWATERGYHVSEAYVDGGSGNDPNLPRRPQTVARAASEGAVLVYVEPSWLARDPKRLLQILAECAQCGVGVRFVGE